MFLLPEGHTGEVREPPKKQCSFENRGALDRKVLTLFFGLQRCAMAEAVNLLPLTAEAQVPVQSMLR